MDKKMTKRQLEKLARKNFFTAVEEAFKGNVDVDTEGGGRWNFTISGIVGEYELGHICYGGDVTSFAIKGDDNYNDMEVIADELDNLWKQIYSKTFNS